MSKGRGWHGEPERHARAARGIKTRQQLAHERGWYKEPIKYTAEDTVRDIRMVKMANKKMRNIIRWLSPHWDHRGLTWQISVREQDKLTKSLDDIIETLDTVRLSIDMNEEYLNAIWDIKTAWSSKSEKDRTLHLEAARERLHSIIRDYLIEHQEYEVRPL